MSVLRLEVVRALAARLEREVPELQGRVAAVQATNWTELPLPSLAMRTVRMRFQPHQSRVVGTRGFSGAIMSHGRHEALVQLRLAAATDSQRYRLEQAVIDVFMQDNDRPGVLLVPVTGCPELGDVRTSWDLDGDEWEDEAAFESHWQSIMTLTGSIPALTVRGGVYTIEQLLLGIHHDMGITPAGDFPAGTEIVQINQDGSFAPAQGA